MYWTRYYDMNFTSHHWIMVIGIPVDGDRFLILILCHLHAV